MPLSGKVNLAVPCPRGRTRTLHNLSFRPALNLSLWGTISRWSLLLSSQHSNRDILGWLVLNRNAVLFRNHCRENCDFHVTKCSEKTLFIYDNVHNHVMMNYFITPNGKLSLLNFANIVGNVWAKLWYLGKTVKSWAVLFSRLATIGLK